jgi:ferric-dicitrate binding protein FerR (iron transport regulator)
MTPDAEDALTREELGAHAADPAWRDERRLAVAIGAALRADHGATTARTVLTLIHRGRGSAPQRLVHRSLSARKRRRHVAFIRSWAAAALLALTIGAGTWWALQPPTVAFFNDGRALIAGSILNSAGDITFHDGSHVVINAGTRLALISAQDRQGLGAGKRLRLEIGSLTATVAKQPVGASLVITTPQGDVTVVGTQFTLSVDALLSRLDVRVGRVRIGNGAGTVDVEAGTSATLMRDAEPQIIAKIIDPPETVPLAPLMIWDVEAPQSNGSWTHGSLVTVDGRRCIEGRLGFPSAPDASLVCWVALEDQTWSAVPEATLQFEVFAPIAVHEIEVQIHNHAGANWGATLPVQGGRWQVCRVRLDQLLPFTYAPNRPLTAADALDDLTLYTVDGSAGPCRFRDLHLDPPEQINNGSEKNNGVTP